MSYSVGPNGQEELKFHPVLDPSLLLPVLKERHPVSCMIQNQILHHEHFKTEMDFYVLGMRITSESWIVSNNFRHDYGNNFLISAPNAIAEGKQEISDDIRKCFLNPSWVDWNNLEKTGMFFGQLTKPVSNMITEIAANVKGHLTEIHPCFMYYMEKEDALKIEEITNDDPNIQIRRLDPSKNEHDFILKTWKYARPSSEPVVRKCISKNVSGGVFVNGECVSAVYIPAVGFLSGLYTLKEHRKKGYARSLEKFVFREYAKGGFIPCLTVEIQNPGSIKFHESLGLKCAGQVNGILIKKLDID